MEYKWTGNEFILVPCADLFQELRQLCKDTVLTPHNVNTLVSMWIICTSHANNEREAILLDSKYANLFVSLERI